MITKAFSVYDSKAMFYGPPFFMPSVGAAVRAFSDLANDSGSMVYRHPADFVLYQVGEFDDSSSLLTHMSPGILLGIGSDFVEKKPVQYRPAAMPETKLDEFIRKSIDKPLDTVEEISNGQ